MLEMKSICEHCQRSLLYNSDIAMICSFECTFCIQCASEAFAGKCPNCGGELVRRPRRPAQFACPSNTEKLKAESKAVVGKKTSYGG